jgi:hypothetical protein
MKSSEFSYIDVLDEQYEDVRIMLLDRPELFEDNDDFKILQSFLAQQQQVTPQIGAKVSPVSFLVIPLGKLLSVKHFSGPVVLQDHQTDMFYFEYLGQIYRFPDGERVSGDKLSNTLLFQTESDKDQFLTVLRLKFSDWRLVIKGVQ